MQVVVFFMYSPEFHFLHFRNHPVDCSPGKRSHFTFESTGISAEYFFKCIKTMFCDKTQDFLHSPGTVRSAAILE